MVLPHPTLHPASPYLNPSYSNSRELEYEGFKKIKK